jgi:hypothetical protein
MAESAQSRSSTTSAQLQNQRRDPVRISGTLHRLGHHDALTGESGTGKGDG